MAPVPGKLHVANDVLADMVGHAAMECYGVVGMVAPNAADGISKILPVSRLRRGITLATTDGGIHVDLFVVIEYGKNLTEMEHDGEIPPGKILFGYHLRENDLGQDIFADRLSFHILELPRLARQKKFEEMTDSAEKWAYMFQNIATFAGQPESVPEFSRAVELSRVDSLTQEEKNQYHNAMVSEYEKLGISTAYEQIGHKKGLEEGLEKGIEQGKMEVARKMKEMDLSIAQIVQASGLPEDVVEGL